MSETPLKTETGEMTDYNDLIRRLEAWAPLLSSGYEVPAAGTAMLESIQAIRDLIAQRDAMREELEGIKTFGFRHPGHGHSCAILASKALEAGDE